ncbi:MAG TPA: hypothetical protein PLP29_19900 [Candidatus Ozemobacteraceae bacterium]|nr:hypothetical protein [Candidatus Ozemobacteraceae bacterium]
MQKSVSRIMTLFLAFAAFIAPAFAAEAPIPAETRTIERIERYVYGAVQTGESAERLGKLETDLLGRRLGRSAAHRATNLNTLVFKGSSGSPSLDMKLNFLEWKVFRETRGGKLAERIEALDVKVTGQPAPEPLAFRIEQLMQMTVDSGIISLHPVKIPAGTLFRVKLAEPVSSANVREGDTITLAMAADLVIDRSVLVVSRGAPVVAEVEKVRRGGRFGRSGFIKLRVNDIPGIDATPVPVKIIGFAGNELDRKKLGMAAGASVLGYLAMGPVGLVGGAFVKGQDAVLPAGTELDVETISPTQVTGIVVTNGN